MENMVGSRVVVMEKLPLLMEVLKRKNNFFLCLLPTSVTPTNKVGLFVAE